MNRDFLIDYLVCILFRVMGLGVRILPKELSLFLGRRLGDALLCFNAKHRSVVYANIKTAFGEELSPSQLKKLAVKAYRAFGQNLMEIFFIPMVDKKYFQTYITVEGRQHIDEAFRRGRGVIFLGAHEGSWELSSIICANLGFPFVLFAREQQRYPLLDRLLNSYRTQKGCRIIQRDRGARNLIAILQNNEAIGMTVDQGGKYGIPVKFFGKNASMPTGAVKFGLRYGAAILPSFYVRVKGPYIKVIVNPPFELKKSGNFEDDVRANLQELVRIFEQYIKRYPHEYLWSYKIWKYSNEKNLLVLSDGKTGHLRQSQAVAKLVAEILQEKGMTVNIQTEQPDFKNRLSGLKMTVSSILASKYVCQGCMWCLKSALREATYTRLRKRKFDIIISCGSKVATVNYVLSRENLAQSIAILKPSILGFRRFDLVILPEHDNPPVRKNVLITQGALNLIDEDYLKAQSQGLFSQGLKLNTSPSVLKIGLLLGGDTRRFSLTKERVREIITQIKRISEKVSAEILVTTSRRTANDVEALVKNEFKDYPLCRLLIIANERNIPEAVGGIISLSDIIVTSPESISMVSEAASSKKYIIVFKAQGLNRKHRRFLASFVQKKYITLVDPQELGTEIETAWLHKPAHGLLEDNQRLKERLRSIL